jgi:hypothetical protein
MCRSNVVVFAAD